MSSPRKAVGRGPHRLAVIAVFALVSLQAPGALQSTAEAGPLKVFVLVGQSNMQGKGDVQQLKALATADETKATFGHWVDARGAAGSRATTCGSGPWVARGR